MSSKGKLIVISAPSGAGKSTVVAELCKQVSNLQISISCTTRPKRPQEVEGKHYYFISREEFERRKAAGDFIEWAKVHNHLYGTPKAELLSAVEAGKNVILDIDVQGGMILKQVYPEALSIFLAPPNLDVLRERLKKRATDSPEQISLRLKNALHELTYQNKYDYCIINDDLEAAVKKLKKIIETINDDSC